MSAPKTIHVQYPEPHLGRMKEILKAHPEVKKLFGPNSWSALIILGIVVFQMVIASFAHQMNFWMILAFSWLVGAVMNHAMFVLIHEAAHNLIFTGSKANKIWSIIANLPVVFPAAIGFRTFHLIHHRFQGDLNKDADLSGPQEAAWVGNSWFRKTLWLLGFIYVEGVVRPNRLKNIRFMNDPWIWINVGACLAFAGVMGFGFGWESVSYLLLSSVFCVGLHPLGARWIQEHYVFHAPQETYSYYGSFNYVMLNVGYHNEHHDLMVIPWNRLPTLRKMASEFYEPVHSHTSYWKLLFRFIFDKNITLYSRVTRDEASLKAGQMKNNSDEFSGELVTATEPVFQ
jgi:sphingolipid 4-desaturase/C4-monooxygenase